jgi:uncharacterized HAD superfamily protein
MTSQEKKIKKKIGFDLDGVIVAGPPFVPKSFLERCFRGGQDSQSLNCYFPYSAWEQKLRRFFHQSLFRPAIKANLASLKELGASSDYEIYLISARYSFLFSLTNNWLNSHQLTDIFQKVILNQDNQPPHLFKQTAINDLGLAVYFEDDEAIVNFLRQNNPQTQIVLVNSPKFNFKSYL